jgi:PDZ domain-containing protein
MQLIKKNKGFTALITALVVVVILLVPIPKYYIETPGTTQNLKSFVHVVGHLDNYPGSFNITTVAQRNANLFGIIKAQFNKYDLIENEKQAFGGVSQKQDQIINQYYMESAENNAIGCALRLAGEKYTLIYKGIYIMSIQPDSSFKKKLLIGDTVTHVNGKKFTKSSDFISYIKSLNVGDQVTIGFTQEGGDYQAVGKLIELENGNTGIGVGFTDHSVVTSKTPITIDAGQIGGPSGGLMFTLETYQTLTNKDLRHGRKIAGTGTIDLDGNVGRIGGIDKKIVTASQNGASVFFAPDDTLTPEIKKANPGIKTNYEEAVVAGKEIHTKMKIVPVKTVNDAIKYLEKK